MRDAGKRTGSGHPAVAGGAGIPAAQLHLRARLSDRDQPTTSTSPAIGWLLFAVLIGWSVACAVAYLQGFGRRPAWVLAEIVVVVALMLSTEFVASDQWALDNQSWPTTLWATNATISAAILFGSDPGHAHRRGGDDRQHGA